MTLSEQMKQDIDSLVFDTIHNGMSKSELLTECKLIASSYNIGYGYVCSRVATAHKEALK